MKILPIPFFFEPNKVSQVWRVPYDERATQALQWAKEHQLQSATQDKIRTALLLIDVQNTFCLLDFELFVGGKSKKGAIEDNIRLCEFIYRNLANITEIIVTLDTHTARQIFHPVFWVNQKGEFPSPGTIINYQDVKTGVWRVNPELTESLGQGDYNFLVQYASHYVKKLNEQKKYPLTIWPYHSLLGGIGHCLVSAVEEAIFFHNIARNSQTHFEIKGNHPLTENYSVLQPEILTTHQEVEIGKKNQFLINKLLSFDKLIITGQAKSHCVAWTVSDLLSEINKLDSNLANKIYLLEDCTSPVVIDPVIDFTEAANATFQRFAQAGMHLIKSTEVF
jgi:nicotinamidase-related amidase